MSPSQSQTRSRRGKSKRWPPRPTTARNSYAGLVMSLALHVGLVLGTYITWRDMLNNIPQESHTVPVDLVIAANTNLAPEAPPPDKLDIPKPALEQPALPDFVQAEPAPVPPVPEIKIKPTKPIKTDQDQDKAKKPTNQDFAALLNKLTAPQTPPKNAKPGTRTIEGVGNANLATASLIDALKSQIDRCWSPPVGAPNPNDLVVSFDLRLNRDGTVASLAQLGETVARATASTYTQASVLAASRAIYQCQPYRLPQETYTQWQEVNPLRFDPRHDLGQ
jgi:hypothetical protein